MAITTIHPIKSSLKKALDYICNPEKTDKQVLVSSFGCTPQTADIEFGFTRKYAIDKGNNLAHHMIQSFEPGESNPDEVHRIGQLLADEALQGKYEYVLTTHIDKGHIHNHIIFNSVDFENHKKYWSNNKSRYRIRNISDKLCKEAGLSVVVSENWKAKSVGEVHAERSGKSWKEQLKQAIDRYIDVATSFDDLLRHMGKDGYQIKRAKYTSYKLPSKMAEGRNLRFTGGSTLGKNYTDERISQRIENRIKTTSRKKSALPPNKEMRLLIDIANNEKMQENKGLEHWAKIENLKQSAKTMNFLSENKLGSYEQLNAKVKSLHELHDKLRSSIKDMDKSMKDMQLLIKHSDAYQQTKSVYEKYAHVKDRSTLHFQVQHQIILHEASRKALKVLEVNGKVPNPKVAKLEYSKLKTKREQILQQYNALKKEIKKFDMVKSNIDTILNQSHYKEKETER